MQTIDSEIPNAEAKCLAFSRLCAAIETPIWLDVQRHNQLVDDIIGFHSTRLATAAAMLTAYNATIPQTTRDGTDNINAIPIGFQSLYDPKTSDNGRDYLNTPANGTANILAWHLILELVQHLLVFQLHPLKLIMTLIIMSRVDINIK